MHPSPLILKVENEYGGANTSSAYYELAKWDNFKVTLRPAACADMSIIQCTGTPPAMLFSVMGAVELKIAC